MGFLVDQEETALMWRGLMLNRAVQHFLEDVQWGEMDYLVIDMPPGTGDVQMGLARMLPRAEMIIVTSPSKVAQKVAVRVANVGRSTYLRIVGVIENMSSFVNEEGKVYELFGRGGGEELARDVGVPLLGKVPIDRAVAIGGDDGEPVVFTHRSGGRRAQHHHRHARRRSGAARRHGVVFGPHARRGDGRARRARLTARRALNGLISGHGQPMETISARSWT